MATENQNIYRQVYNANENGNLLSGLHHVTCVLLRRGLLAAGFNASNELLSIHYAWYNNDRCVWELDFFEPLFADEPLLADHDKITKIFFCSSRYLVVPEELYDRYHAEEWLKKIHFIEPVDEVQHYHQAEDKSYYLYAIPVNIKALVRINCPTAPIMPMATYQFLNSYTRGARLHCFIGDGEAVATLYHYGSLLWHRVFDYAAPEDIAYEIRLVCEEHKLNADKIALHCTTLSPTEYPVANELSQYFSELVTAGGHSINGVWSATLSLVKQLETCG